MDLTDSADDEAFRYKARQWLEANVPDTPLESGDTPQGFEQHIEWERKLFDAGWAVVAWPRGLGGMDASLWQWLIFEEEYHRVGAPSRVTQNGISLLAPTLFDFGTEEQQNRILPRMAAAKDVWAQGWSEPESGSDLASVQSRAIRDDANGGWRVFGQKTWTTRGAYCTHLFGLFRTDPEAQRHRGLTYLMLPLTAPGVTVRPFERLDGDPGFADVFFDGVFVPDQDVLGQVNQGWKVAMSTTGSERGLSLRSPGRFHREMDNLVRLAKSRQELFADDVDAQLAEIWADVHAYESYTFQQVFRIENAEEIGAESSLNKIWWSQMDIRLHELAVEIEGPNALFDSDWMRGYQFALGGPIYAGTNEIQKNIIAERILGLPR